MLYEYNEFLERLLFRYKEQRDVELAPVFFYLYVDRLKELSKKYTICTMCSDDEHRLKRGFEPVNKMLEYHGILVYSPLYKQKNMKQSSMHKNQRQEIKKYIHRKEMYPLPLNKPILLIDDVLTTGNTLERGIELLKPAKVMVLCANPLWIKENSMAKQKRF